MTDQPAPAAPPEQPQTIPLGAVPITVLTQYVKDLSFENPNAPASLAQLGPSNQPQVGISVNIQTGPVAAPQPPTGPSGQPAFECALTIKAEGKLGTGDAVQIAFIIEVTYAGLFAFPPGLPDGAVRALLMVEAPRLLFPFARLQLSEAAQAGGYGPLLINPIDFGGLYQQQLNYEQQASQQQSGTA